MTQFATFQPEPYQSFERGMNRDAAKTSMPQGYYEDAVNMLLASDASGRHPTTVKLDAELDSAITWPTGNMVWFAPFTYSSYNSTTGVITFNTHLLTHRSSGAYYRYDVGSPGTSTLVRRYATAASSPYTHFAYDQWLCVLNGRNAPLKYGQHFVWNGQNEPTPYAFPIGSKPVTAAGPSLTGETWTHGGTNAFVADASVPGGGSRVGVSSLKLAFGQTSQLAFSAPTTKNFEAGPDPYGGTNFAATDFFAFSYYKAANGGGTPYIRIRFGNAAMSAYFQFEVATPATGAWTTSTLLRSAATTTGSPDWTAIARVDFISGDNAGDTYIDDVYFLYADAPPAAGVGTSHKDRIVLGGVPVVGADNEPALSTLFWSDSEQPDEFPSSNQQVISGGHSSLARTSRISALREYGDAVIVGTPNAIFAWTVGSSGDPSRSVITTETGIDSHQAIVETPAGSLLFPWQRGFYILRQTGRAYVSEKIFPILKDLYLEEPWWTIGVRDERTKTIRFWFRERAAGASVPTKTSGGIIFDFVRAQELGESVWVSRMTQVADFAVECYVNGVRETLYSNNDGQDIYRMHITEGGTLESSLTLPWLSLQGRDKLVKWAGMAVPYAATSKVRVFIRYAQNPHEFENAIYEEVDSLPPNPDASVQGRVFFGRTSRWAQVKFQSQTYGFELYPPLEYVAAATQRQP